MEVSSPLTIDRVELWNQISLTLKSQIRFFFSAYSKVAVLDGVALDFHICATDLHIQQISFKTDSCRKKTESNVFNRKNNNLDLFFFISF